MVDDQVDRHKRVDLFRVTAKASNSRPHRRQIHDSRHSGEILHDHTRRKEGNTRAGSLGSPCRDVFHIGLGDFFIVTLTEGCLQDDADGKRKKFEVR